ncbi:folate receptor gamma-like isoform X2 [Gigantopelta aegis]|uniref:folate receptor gamma-like isoform X2 n=1 Tax=Gigantopelta aegis TaxID=1735272 RepID=UPI001B889BFF|nr:folate receptor gamma-like isoform X2 [Gigantopelta aegis]
MVFPRQCAPWKNRSCCTRATSESIHLSDTWLNFNWNHCGWLSARCREQFIRDLCFYECSPNLGPWLVKVNMKIRSETQRNVPLCQSGCTNWWNDCKNDLTCKADWSSGFNWTTGSNTCPTGSECKPFHEIYPDANAFCEQVWGQAWKVVPDNQPCMYTWFDGDRGNPNDKVALERAKHLISGSELSRLSYMMQIILFLVAFISL